MRAIDLIVRQINNQLIERGNLVVLDFIIQYFQKGRDHLEMFWSDMHLQTVKKRTNWTIEKLGGGLTLHEIRKAKIVVIKVLCVFDKLSYKLVQALQNFFCNDALIVNLSNEWETINLKFILKLPISYNFHHFRLLWKAKQSTTRWIDHFDAFGFSRIPIRFPHDSWSTPGSRPAHIYSGL